MNTTAEDNTVATDVESIANEIFDTAGVTDDTELTFENNETLIVEDTTSETETETTELVDQPEKKSTIAENEQKLFAGKYKTVEDLEKAYTEKTQTIVTPQVAPVQPVVEGVPDLNEREITLLIEQDEQDGTNFNQEYFLDKIKDRDLTDFEVKTIKDLDLENGSNFFQEYITTSTERNVMLKLRPVIEPLQEAQQRERYDKYLANEKAINATREVEFGKDRLEILEAKLQEDGYVKNLLKTSVTAPIINNLWDSGNKAMSHKLLLREADLTERTKQRDVKTSKQKASVSADVGSSAASTDNSEDYGADTIEDAVEHTLAGH